jgi:hypothetical protein
MVEPVTPLPTAKAFGEDEGSVLHARTQRELAAARRPASQANTGLWSVTSCICGRGTGVTVEEGRGSACVQWS